ncbi:hypothetical protein DL95DRAFT_418426 [Leptodontidium sp. 2 PMI_412]|nr:hypothetical protein DL95DRAFT_418426 [Leptodontidium sp. 2 PMI_412]
MHFSTILLPVILAISGAAASPTELRTRQVSSITKKVSSDMGDVNFTFEPFLSLLTGQQPQALVEEHSKLIPPRTGSGNGFGAVIGGKRERLTQETVARLITEFPDDKIVVCNVGFDFSAGTILEQGTISFNAKIGANVSFEVLRFRTGKFVRRGDGGFANWAYSVFTDCIVDGATLDCSKLPPV